MIRFTAVIAVMLVTGCANAEVGIVERAAWGATAPRSDVSRYEDYDVEGPTYDTVVLHTTALGAGVGADEMRRIQNYQMNVRGFSDIAYNFLIDSEGGVFEGRALSLVPAHAGRTQEGDRQRDIRLDPDFGAMGIVFSGNRDVGLTDGQVTAAIALIRKLTDNHPIRRIITHTEVADLVRERGLTPVSEHDPHTCPGAGPVDGLVTIRRTLDPSFDESRFRSRFEAGR